MDVVSEIKTSYSYSYLNTDSWYDAYKVKVLELSENKECIYGLIFYWKILTKESLYLPTYK